MTQLEIEYTVCSESDLDADDEANNSGEVKRSKEDQDQVRLQLTKKKIY